jgi:hypothetical protein
MFKLLSANNLEKTVFLIVAAVLLPFILIVIEKTILPYPAFVEEVAKALVIFFLILNLSGTKYKIAAGALFGFLFGLSENIFYLINIIENGEIIYFWQRFLWTTPMHIITVLVILFSGLAGKKFIIFGLAGAIILHALFNNVAAEFLMR